MEYNPNETPKNPKPDDLSELIRHIDNELQKIKESVNDLYNSAHGSMYQYELGTTITISASDTYYPITSMSVGKLYGFTFASDTLTVDAGADGRYLASIEASYSDGGNTNFEIALSVNGTIDQHTAAHASTTGSLNTSASGTGIVDLVAGDAIQLEINNHTNTNNAVIEHASISLVKIGQTLKT